MRSRLLHYKREIGGGVVGKIIVPMAGVGRYLAMAAIIAAVGACASGSGTIIVRDWDTDTIAGDFTAYPEQSDDPVYGVPQVAKAYKDVSTTFGIAVSGGGNRSAAAALGQMRALTALGWMEDAQYLSVISGGSWAVIPYVFMPERTSDDKVLGDKAFLGSYVPPQKLTEKILRTPSDAILAQSISNAGIVWPFLWNAATLTFDESYSRSIGRIYLKPVGLDDPDKFIVQSPAQLAELNRQNAWSGNTALTKTDVYMPHSGEGVQLKSASVERSRAE
jgi:hypothetical protein